MEALIKFLYLSARSLGNNIACMKINRRSVSQVVSKFCES